MSQINSAPAAAKSTVPSTRQAVLLFTDIVGSTDLKTQLGTSAYTQLLARHNEIFETTLRDFKRAVVIKHTGDGYFAAFPNSADAVRFALAFQDRMRNESWGTRPLSTRLGIHLGEVMLLEMAGRRDVVGLSADIAARLMSLAEGDQILLTAQIFDEARQMVDKSSNIPDAPASAPLRWVAHGPYMFKGCDEPLEVFQVGIENVSSFTRPMESEKVHRATTHDQEPTLGWRPAVQAEIPGRPEWKLLKKLGDGAFGEVWLGQHIKLGKRRVFKFCFNADRVRSLKREFTLFRLLREGLGHRPDIATLHQVKLDEPPFYLESEYTAGGNLIEWAARKGGIDKIPLIERLDIVAKVADAVAAAHSVGVLHKDIKPANVLIHQDKTGYITPRLSDFGIGMLADRSQLQNRAITEAGFTQVSQDQSISAGTRMYSPPESLLNKPFTTHGDVFALGVLLYQMVIGKLDQPLASGWERDVADSILQQDIASFVDHDVDRRVSAATVVAERIRTLEFRQSQRQMAEQEKVVLISSARRVRRLRLVAAACLVLLALGAAAAVGAAKYVADLKALKQQADQNLVLAQHRERDALAAKQSADDQRVIAEKSAKEAQDQKIETLNALDVADRNLKEAQRQAKIAENALATAAASDKESAAAKILAAQRAQEAEVEKKRTGEAQTLAESEKKLAVDAHEGKNRLIATRVQDLLNRDPLLAAMVLRELPDTQSVVSLKTVYDLLPRSPVQTAQLNGSAYVPADISWSRDGKRIAVVCLDKSIRIWNADHPDAAPLVLPGGKVDPGGMRVLWSPDGQQLVVTGPQFIPVICKTDGSGSRWSTGNTGAFAAWSPDGRWLVLSGMQGNTPFIVSADAGGSKLPLDGSIGRDPWSPDGSQILTTFAEASGTTAVHVWRADGAGTPVIFRRSGVSLSQPLWSPDGAKIAIIAVRTEGRSTKAEMQIWNPTGEGEPTILSGLKSATSVRDWWSADGRKLAAIVSDSTLTIWGSDGAPYTRSMPGSMAMTSPSPDARWFPVIPPEKTLVMVGTDASARSMSVQIADVLTMAWSPDARHFAVGLEDKSVRVFDMGLDPPGTTILRSSLGHANHVAWSGDGANIVVSYDKGARVWNPGHSGGPISLLDSPSPVLQAQWTPDQSQIVTVGEDKAVRLFKSSGPKLPAQMSFNDAVVGAAWSPDGKRVLTWSRDKTARIWTPGDSSVRTIVLEGHTGAILSACWSSDGTRVLTASSDMTARVWTVSGAGKTVILRGHTRPLTSAAWSPDGNRVVTASEDMTARVCNSDGSGNAVILKGHTALIRAVAWSPANDRIVTVSDDKTGRLWNAGSPECLAVLAGHREPVLHTAWSPDGSQFLTIGDTTTRVWNANGSGDPIVLVGHETNVRHAAWSPDGMKIATTTDGGVTRIWNLSWPELRRALWEYNGALTPEQRQQYLGESSGEAVANASHRAL